MKKFLSIILSLTMILSCMTTAVFATETTEPSTAYELLNGKKVLFIGDSYVYYGRTVEAKGNNLTQSSRSNDKGGFYQLCKANGIDVEVTNWTFGSHGLRETFDGVCTETTCPAYTNGESHEDYLTDRNFDYVIVSPTRGADLEIDFSYIMNFFKEANSEVKFVCLGSMGIHGINKDNLLYPDMLAYYETLKEQGVIVADWGEMVSDIVEGKVSVPGATQLYDRSTFVVKDNYHPNLLSGYLTTLFAYCAITGESAANQPYSYITDGTASVFNMQSYLSNFYTNGDADTNFPEVLASQNDMSGLQQLVDGYLAPRGKELLDNKKVLFIGNSFIFRGLTVTPKYTLTQSSRTGDTGYFYQLCKANGIDVEVTNWTYSGHGLGSIFGAPCNVSNCDGYGENHEDYLIDRDFDYVFFSAGSGENSDLKFKDSVDYIVNTFRAVNPDVKFVCLGTATAYGWDSRDYAQTNITGYYETLKEMGIPVADWGKVVTDIIYGNYSVPGATQVYDKKSFIVSDGYHENMLAGYITSLMAYCAITGEKATGQPYSFYNDTTLNSEFDIPAYMDKYYTGSGANESNADEIMASPSDMNGIQQVVDLVLSGEEQLEIKENVHYAESFDNDTGAKVTDLSDYGLVKVKSSGHEYITTGGKFYVNNGEWKGFTSLVYNPAYTFTAKNYNIEVSGKNELGAASQRMAVYLNYKDVKNYYAVRLSEAKYENNVWKSTATVQIVKCENGETTVLAEAKNTGIKQEFAISIEKKGNTISVYDGGDLVVAAVDDGTMIDGKYVAFGTENTRGYFDSISVSPMYINETYLEGFNNTTGEKITDLSEYGLTKAKNSGYEYVNTNGQLVIRKSVSDYSGLNSIMYNPAYTYTNSRYNVTMKAKNENNNKTAYVTLYLNYKDIDNYYAINVGGTKYESGKYTYTATVQIVKCVDGVKTVLAEKAESGVGNPFTVEAQIMDNIITVSNGGEIVAYAQDNGDVVDGKYIAFGTTGSRGYIDSIVVTPIADDKAFSEGFSNADLTDGTWVNADAASINSSGRLRINTNGKLVYNKDWKVYGSDYTLSYTTYNSYGATSNRMNLYFNYQDSKNYYCISFGGAKYDSTTKTYTTERKLIFTKMVNGTKTEEEFSLGYSSSTGKITLVSDGSSIKIFVGSKLIVDKTDDTNMLTGGYIALSSTNYTGGWFDDISLDITAAKAYDGTTRIFSLDDMAGKTITIKKNVDTELTPVAVVKNGKGMLCAVGVGESSSDKATVEVTLPNDFTGGDLYLYQWSDMNTLVPLAETEKINLD